MQKLFYLFLLILILIASCKRKENKQEINFSANIGGIIYNDSTSTIQITTTLNNTTKDTICFLSMGCSYEDFFTTNTNNFKVQPRYDCYSNGPLIKSIPPNSKLDQFIQIRPINKDIQIINSKLKIGMYFITPKKEDTFNEIVKSYENRKTAKILWSEQLDLKRLYRKHIKQSQMPNTGGCCTTNNSM